jgi:uncharacterized phiE125 gp8 family phage protein
MSVNTIYSTKVTESAGEPVSASDAKLHASIDYSDFDTLIPIYLSAARIAIERATGLALVQKTIKCQAYIFPEAPFMLAYSPVKQVNYIMGVGSTSSCTDESPVVLGANDEVVMVSEPGQYEIEYVAGFDTCPADLKLAIFELFTFIFTHRGEYSEGKLDISLEAARIIGENARFLV